MKLKSVGIVTALVMAVLAGKATSVMHVWDEGAAAAPEKKATFIGGKACKKCHFKEHKTWKKTHHAGAWEALPEKYRDPKQKDEQGRQCISCHVTAFGKGDLDGFKSADESEHLLGVQCEACHGPGSLHVEATKELKKKKQKTFAEGADKHIQLHSDACSRCHNPHFSYAKKYGGE